MKSNRRSRQNSGHGAALVEAAITLPVVLYLFLIFVDLSRYFYVSMNLNYAAQAAADVASKLDVDLDTDTAACQAESGNTCDSVSTTPCHCYFNLVKDNILNTAVRHAIQVAKPSGTAEWSTRLVSFTQYQNSDYVGYDKSPKLGSITSDAAFLRPGERVTRDGGTGDDEFFVHPTRQWGTGSGYGWPKLSDGETWGNVMAYHPLIIHLEADMRAVTPFIGPIRIRANQLSYRRTKDYGAAVPPIVTPPPSPTYTWTPTNTPLPTQTLTPSITPTPTVSPTITQTPTPTESPTPSDTPSITPTPTESPIPTVTPTPEDTFTPSITPTPTETFTPSATPTNTNTPTDTPTLEFSYTPTPTETATSIPTATSTATETPVPTPSATPSLTPTPENTATRTPVPSPTVTNTVVQCTGVHCGDECGCQGAYANCCQPTDTCRQGCGAG